MYADFSWDALPVLETSFQVYIAEGQEEIHIYMFFWGRNPQRIRTFMTTYKSMVDTPSSHTYLNLICSHPFIEGRFSLYITEV